MNCTRTAPKTHWQNVGYRAAKCGMTYDAIRLPGQNLANEWIRAGMARWERKAALADTRRAVADAYVDAD